MTDNTETAMLPVEQWVFAQGDILKTDSRIVAKAFGKRHDNVMRDIRELECSDKFRFLNFELVTETVTYTDADGNEQTRETGRTSHYEISQDGFMILVMGFTGKPAMEIKERFIAAFNEMRTMIADYNYGVIARLHRALEAEAISRMAGSFAGRALRRRQSEKRLNHAAIERLRALVQPDIFQLIEDFSPEQGLF